MSLVFGSGRHLAPVTFSEKFGPDGGVLLDQALWDALNEDDQHPNSPSELEAPTQRIGVILEPLAGPSHAVSSGLSKLVEWATLDATVTGAVLPKSWLKEYPRIFSDPLSSSAARGKTYRIGCATPVVLLEVVLLAKSPSALHLAQTETERIKEWLCTPSTLLRQGSIHTFDSVPLANGNGSSAHSEGQPPIERAQYDYEIIMTQPVLQGIANSEETSFIITMAVPFDSPSGSPATEDEDLASPVDSQSDYSSDLSDVDGIEIGEGFLASSVPPLTISSLNGLGGVNGHHSNPQWDQSTDSLAATDKAVSTNGNGASYDSGSEAEGLGTATLLPRSLTVSVPVEAFIPKGDDPEAHIYVSSTDLGKLGSFSGDWAVVSLPSSPSSRLVRLIANDSLFSTDERRTLLASPILLQNIFPDGLQSSLSVRPTPFASRAPSLPTARSITVARVSSPYANNKIYQPLFLRALKDHFEQKVRLLRLGDLIAVPIRAEDARLMDGGFEEESDEEIAHKLKDALLEQEFPLASNVGTGVVFFKITSIVHDIVSIDVDESKANTSDSYLAATLGELGCWVDSKVTQILQTGAEHSRVPDVAAYLDIHEGFARLPLDITPAISAGTPYAKLLDLVSAAFLPNAVQYDLRLSVLLKGARGIGKQTTARWVAQEAGVHVIEVNCYDVVGESDIKTEATVRARFEKAAECAPCILLLRHIEALARNNQTLETGKEPPMATILQDCIGDLRQDWMMSGFPVFIFATTTEPEKIPQGVLSCFKHEINFEAPAEAERLGILTNLLRTVTLAPDVGVKSLATQTAALVAADLVDLVHRAKSACVQRTISSGFEADALESGLVLTGADFETALNEARNSYSESIGAPKIPNVTWDDVGGLASVKKDILDTIQLPLDYPELFADGLKKRSGILLYGPPGTGKTLLAKAVATSCSLNFFSVKGPELLNMYIGESEANVRRVFQRARDAKPCVIFFDELDSVAPKRGNHGDSGGVMDRIVSQLLAELDGMADGGGGADVFVIGATNRPDLLDSALLRPGRFDRMLYLGVSDNHDAQLNILKALTRKFRLDPGLDLKDIADQCPFNYTGADFYALCSDAMLKSMARKAQEIDDRIAELNALPPPYSHPHPLTPQYYLAEMATSEETDVLVSRKDFELALSELVPSVSQGEMDHYAEVQRRFASDTINAIKDKEEIESAPQGSLITNNIDSHNSLDAGEAVLVAPLVSRVDKGKGRATD